MIAFIDDHRAAYGVEPICRVLPIAPSTYRVHAARRADPGRLPARARSDAALTVEIRRVFETNFRVYGVPLHGCTADAGDGPARGGAGQKGPHHDPRPGRNLPA
jgi:hypothetical protein